MLSAYYHHDCGELRRPYKLFFSLKQYPGGNLKSAGVAYLYTHLLLYLMASASKYHKSCFLSWNRTLLVAFQSKDILRIPIAVTLG